jgi:hypothetical protein
MQLTTHYDHACGANPRWRRALTQALKGHPSLLETEFLMLSGFSPAGARMLQASFKYAESGQQVYYLGRRMQSLLGNTNIDKVPQDFHGVPYPCFYLAFQNPPYRIWGGKRTQWHEIGGVYVQEHIPGILSLVAWGKENERSTYVGDDATYWINIKLDDVPSTDGMLDIDSYMAELITQLNQDASDPGIVITPDVRQEQNKNVTRLARVVINLLLYLNSSQPELVRMDNPGKRAKLKARLKKAKNAKKKRKYQRQLAALPQARVIWIGKSLEQAPPNVVAQPGAGPSRVVKQHWRKGHWHPYWTGPRKDASGQPQKGTEQVLRWVQPTLVGRDMASLVAARGTVRRFLEDKETP